MIDTELDKKVKEDEKLDKQMFEDWQILDSLMCEGYRNHKEMLDLIAERSIVTSNEIKKLYGKNYRIFYSKGQLRYKEVREFLLALDYAKNRFALLAKEADNKLKILIEARIKGEDAEIILENTNTDHDDDDIVNNSKYLADE